MSASRHPDTLGPRATVRALEMALALLGNAAGYSEDRAVSEAILATRGELVIALSCARAVCKGKDFTGEQLTLFAKQPERRERI